MKMRKKLISLISSLAIIVSMLTTVAYADEAGTIDLNVGVDGDGYYYVDILFDVPDVNLDIAKTRTANRIDYYKGTGVIGGEFDFTNVTEDDFYQILTGVGVPASSNFKEGKLIVLLKADKVEDMVGADDSGSTTVVRLGTNYTETDKTKEEIETIFSAMSKMNVKIVTVDDDTSSSTNPGLFSITTYAAFDGDYGLAMKSDEPVVTEKIPTATAAGEVDGVKIGTEYKDAETDVAAAVAAGLLGEEGQTYTGVKWTVTDDQGTTKTHVQELNISGAVAVKVGLAIQGLAQDAVSAIKAVLQ